MKRLAITGCLFFVFVISNAQTGTSLTQGAKLLFQNTKSKLTTTEKNNIFKQLNFLLSADGKQFIADKEAADFPFDAMVYPTDLNKDGVEEVFILYGNSFTSGSTGSSIVLFIKNSSGNYLNQLGFPGTLPDAIATNGNTYPELVIGGPGFEFPIWKWNGKKYNYSRKVTEAAYNKLKLQSIETISKKYTDTLK